MRCPSSRMTRSQRALLDVEDVLEHLLVVADREEGVARVRLSRGPSRTRARARTLRSEKRWISLRHCDLSDAGQTTSTLRMFDLAREELRDADALDCLAEPHVVGEDRAAGADGERDAVELIGQERRRAGARCGAGACRAPCGSPPASARAARARGLALDEVLGVGRDEERVGRAPRASAAARGARAGVDRAWPEQRRDDSRASARQFAGQRDGERPARSSYRRWTVMRVRR